MGMTDFLIAVDQLGKTLIGGKADETISARAWRLKDKELRWKITRFLVDSIFFWEDNHCESAYYAEMTRKQLPSEYSKE